MASGARAIIGGTSEHRLTNRLTPRKRVTQSARVALRFVPCVSTVYLQRYDITAGTVTSRLRHLAGNPAPIHLYPIRVCLETSRA